MHELIRGICAAANLEWTQAEQARHDAAGLRFNTLDRAGNIVVNRIQWERPAPARIPDAYHERYYDFVDAYIPTPNPATRKNAILPTGRSSGVRNAFGLLDSTPLMIPAYSYHGVAGLLAGMLHMPGYHTESTVTDQDLFQKGRRYVAKMHAAWHINLAASGTSPSACGDGVSTRALMLRMPAKLRLMVRPKLINGDNAPFGTFEPLELPGQLTVASNTQPWCGYAVPGEWVVDRCTQQVWGKQDAASFSSRYPALEAGIRLAARIAPAGTPILSLSHPSAHPACIVMVQGHTAATFALPGRVRSRGRFVNPDIFADTAAFSLFAGSNIMPDSVTYY
jgi:hypothetical protein